MLIGVDLGGTNIRAGAFNTDQFTSVVSENIAANKTEKDVLQQLFRIIDKLHDSSLTAIGVGVAGLVHDGIVYDAVNIPGWKTIPLKNMLEKRYSVPVVIENDANCFALAELYFGKAKSCDSMIGLTIGTGLGTGIIINKRLYRGSSGGAGEFGMMEYRDHCYEYYASGQFFQNVYGISGDLAFQQAIDGNVQAITMYSEFGIHLGNAIKSILFALDIQLIVIGGSVSKAYHFFQKSMWDSINAFEYKRILKSLSIQVSALENSGILGAIALTSDHQYH